MKFRVFMVGFLGGCLVASIGFYSTILCKRNLRAKAKTDYRENPEYYRGMDLFNVMPMVTNKVVMLGDSLTALCDWNELLGRCDFINRGISGDTTEGVLVRTERISAMKPRVCFVMVGINDIQSGVSESNAVENYKTAINQLRMGNIDVTVQSCLPVGRGRQDYLKINQAVISFNKQLKKMCSEKDLCYLDVYSVLVDQEGCLDPRLTLDGVHLKGAGYVLWANKINELLSSSRQN